MAIDVNYYDEIIYITSPTTSVTVQELVDRVRAVEDTVIGLDFSFDIQPGNAIIDAVGKFDIGDGYYTGIVMTLSSTWQIQFWNGVGFGTISGGNIVGGVGGEPIKATGGSDTVLMIRDVGGVIAVIGGSTTRDFTDNEVIAAKKILGIGDDDPNPQVPVEGILSEIAGLNRDNTYLYNQQFDEQNRMISTDLDAYDGTDFPNPPGTSNVLRSWRIEWTYTGDETAYTTMKFARL